MVTEFATEVVRPAAADADEACAAPKELLEASLEIGLPILGLPESLGGVSEERSAMAGTLVAEALAKGDMGLAVATLAPGSVATAIGLWGSDEQQQTYLPAFAGDDVPAAALALTEPQVLFDVLSPRTTAVRKGDGYVLNGVKSLVPRGADAELFVVGAELEGRPVLFLVESSTEGLTVEGDPSMGVRAAVADPADAHRRAVPTRAPCSARPTARRTPSACGSPGSPGARWRSAPARRCSTT